MLVSVLNAVESSGDWSLELVDLIPAKSIVWEEQFAKIGVAQVVFVNDTRAKREIKVDRFFLIQGTITPMYIHTVQSRKDKNELWAYCYEAKGLWQKKPAINLGDNNSGEQSIKTAIEAEVLRSGETSLLDISSNVWPAIGDANLDLMEYYNVHDYIQQALDLGNAGFTCRLDNATGKLYFYGYAGVDKSDTVIFSSSLGSAKDITYTESAEKELTRVYAIGLDGTTPVFAYADAAGSYHDIWAKHIDVRGEFPRPADMSLADYTDALQTRARIALAESGRKFIVAVGSIDMSRLGIDYQMGDTVGVAIPEYSVMATARVAGIKRTIEGMLERQVLLLDKISVQ